MNILALDPSVRETGYAVLNRKNDLIESGRLRAAASLSLQEKIDAIVRDAQDLVEQFEPTAVVVEFPQTFTRGQKRSNATLPSYGMIVGALTWGLRLPAACTVVAVSASAWTRGFPHTKRDPYKAGRVRLVEQLYRLERGSLGAKSVAGNVADAVLIARWFLEREKKHG